MEVVVNIDDALYEKVLHSTANSIPLTVEVLDQIMELLCKGTVLPKGHGTLKDTDAIYREFAKENELNKSDALVGLDLAPVVVLRDGRR